MEAGGVNYRVVEARPARWWRAATYYIETDYGRMGPMKKAAAIDMLSTIYFAALSEQTPVEPEFHAALYENRSEMYTEFPAPLSSPTATDGGGR